MSVPARILCEKFHWKGVRDENDHRSKLLQFSEAVVAEVNRICGDENADIRAYRDKTYELYGVKYAAMSEDKGRHSWSAAHPAYMGTSLCPDPRYRGGDTNG